jgi:hypothetical protein
VHYKNTNNYTSQFFSSPLSKIKGNVNLKTDHEGSERQQSYSSTLPLIPALVGVSNYPAALPPGKKPSTHCTGDRAGPRAGIDRWGKSHPNGKRSPDHNSKTSKKYDQIHKVWVLKTQWSARNTTMPSKHRSTGIYPRTTPISVKSWFIPFSKMTIKSAIFSFTAQQPLAGQGLLIIEASRSQSDTPHSVRLLWTSDWPIAETSTW